MFYDIFYKLFSDLIGETALATAQGQMFAVYGSYAFTFIAVAFVFAIVFKLLKWFGDLFRV